MNTLNTATDSDIIDTRAAIEYKAVYLSNPLRHNKMCYLIIPDKEFAAIAERVGIRLRELITTPLCQILDVDSVEAVAVVECCCTKVLDTARDSDTSDAYAVLKCALVNSLDSTT